MNGFGVTGISPDAHVRAISIFGGGATQYWDEELAYPPGTAARLWLYVNNGWRRFDNSPAHWEDKVQRSFICGGSVRVWYGGAIIVGLVASG